jgi:mannitol/fructose-specific phosphotransferase system IIA component (Ntr-type)
MRLSDYLRRELVIHGLEARDRAGILTAVCASLEESGAALSPEEVFQALWDREEAHSTALGDGVAVPHAVLPTLDDRLLVVVSTKEMVAYGPKGEDPVDILFVLLSPPGKEGEHIKLLARICRLARHPGFLETLRSARDGEELYRTILHEDAQHV